MHSDGSLEMSLRLTERRKKSCVTGSPCPSDLRVKITFGRQLQLLLTELCVALPALHNREPFCPSLPTPGLGGLFVAIAPLLLLFLSCRSKAMCLELGTVCL